METRLKMEVTLASLETGVLSTHTVQFHRFHRAHKIGDRSDPAILRFD